MATEFSPSGWTEPETSTATTDSRPPLPSSPAPKDVRPASTPPPPQKRPELDQETLLVITELRLSSTLRVAQYAPGVLIVKNEQGRTYLTISPEQWQALQTFGAGLAVPQVVFRNLANRISVPLREFYELVVKAHQAGVLLVKHYHAPAPRPAATWKIKLSGSMARVFAAVAIIAGLASVGLNPMLTPENPSWLAVSWVLVVAALSAGNFLAACVARGMGTEVYDPRFNWKSLLPRFQVDLCDAKMAGPAGLLATSLAQLTPMFLALAATAWTLPHATLGVFCAALALLSPLWRSPVWTMIRMRFAKLRLDTQQRFALSLNQVASYRYRAFLKGTDWRYVGIRTAFSVLWLAIALVGVNLFLHTNFEQLWHNYLAADGLSITRTVASIIGLAVAGAALSVLVWMAVQLIREKREERAKTPAIPQPKSLTKEAILAMLAASPLFAQLSEEDRQVIAAAFTAEQYPANAVVIREGDPGDKLYVVFSGEVKVQRALPNGRQETIATLGPSDVFGEVALLQASPRVRTVRTAKKCVLLSLPREVFRDVLLSKVGRESIEHAVQKVRFLQRIGFSQAWSPRAIDAFARRAIFRTYAEGDGVIREGQDNNFFYLVYEGEFGVRKSREEIRRLKIGDYFGEVSLLQNSEATASVVAMTRASCLQVSRTDFLQFLAHEFTVGILFDEQSSERLGRQIIKPRKGHSFEVA